MLSDAQWAELEPLVEACRPRGKTLPEELRRTLSAILWRHRNGARWRAIPQELGPWWQAAQVFMRWAHAGVWERLLELVQERGVRIGMVFLDGTNIRAHQKAAGARLKGGLGRARCTRSAWPLSWRLWDQGLRDRRWGRSRHRLPDRARPSA